MKTLKSFLCAAAVLATVFAAGKAAAFPLTLTSVSATVNATPSYSAITNATKVQYTTRKFTLKDVTLLISNSLVYLGSNPPPANAYIAYEPYNNDTYQTNGSGYYQSVTSDALYHRCFVQLDIKHLAAKFTEGTGTITENDPVETYFGFECIGPDGGNYYASADWGIGSLKYDKTSKGVSMSITGTGPDEGILDSSYDGTSLVSFTFSGKNPAAEWNGPYFLWWY